MTFNYFRQQNGGKQAIIDLKRWFVARESDPTYMHNICFQEKCHFPSKIGENRRKYRS
jgi:hypothetical protein